MLEPPDYTDRLFFKDCCEGLRELPAESVDLLATDPPYNIGYDYQGGYDDTKTLNDYLEFSADWLRQARRVLKPGGSAWIAMGPAMVSEIDVLAKQLGFRKRSQIIWYYTFGVNSAKKLTPASTHFLYYVLDAKNFTFNVSERVPSARQMVYNDHRASTKGRFPDDVWILRPQWVPDGFDPAGDVWYIPRIAGTFKQRRGTPNQMPEQIMGRIIRLSSNPGDIVLDPFAGSGTTPAVAKKLDRRYIAYESFKRDFEIARNRLAEVEVGQMLEGKLPETEVEPKRSAAVDAT